jgi:hypothetical protein
MTCQYKYNSTRSTNSKKKRSLLSVEYKIIKNIVHSKSQFKQATQKQPVSREISMDARCNLEDVDEDTGGIHVPTMFIFHFNTIDTIYPPDINVCPTPKSSKTPIKPRSKLENANKKERAHKKELRLYNTSPRHLYRRSFRIKKVENYLNDVPITTQCKKKLLSERLDTFSDFVGRSVTP